MRALILALLVGGCAVLEPVYDVASKPETFAVCKAADVATTVGILKAGGMEVNPVMHALMGGCAVQLPSVRCCLNRARRPCVVDRSTGSHSRGEPNYLPYRCS
jgi:hypothetical protein